MGDARGLYRPGAFQFNILYDLDLHKFVAWVPNAPHTTLRAFSLPVISFLESQGKPGLRAMFSGLTTVARPYSTG
jgi:hypothetical protein